MIDIRCNTGCAPADDCVLVVAPKYCICMESDIVADEQGFKSPAPTDTAEAAARNPSLVTGAPRIGGEVVTRPGGYAGETDTLAGGAAGASGAAGATEIGEQPNTETTARTEETV